MKTLFSFIPENEPIGQSPAFPHLFLSAFAHSGDHTFTLSRTYTHTRKIKLYYTDTGTQQSMFIYTHTHTYTHTPRHHIFICNPVFSFYFFRYYVFSFYLSLIINYMFNYTRPFQQLFSFPTPPLLPNYGWLKRLATRGKVGMLQFYYEWTYF